MYGAAIQIIFAIRLCNRYNAKQFKHIRMIFKSSETKPSYCKQSKQNQNRIGLEFICWPYRSYAIFVARKILNIKKCKKRVFSGKWSVGRVFLRNWLHIEKLVLSDLHFIYCLFVYPCVVLFLVSQLIFLYRIASIRF